MSNAHISNGGEVHLTRAQQRHLQEIRRILPEIPDHISIQAAKDTLRSRHQFSDKSTYWSFVIDHATKLHEAEVSRPFRDAKRGNPIMPPTAATDFTGHFSRPALPKFRFN